MTEVDSELYFKMRLRSASAVGETSGGKVRWPTKTGFQIDKPLCFYLSKLSTEELLKMLYKVY